MASIFTFDPDPPRISSPWSNTPVSTPKLRPVPDGDSRTLGGLTAPAPFLLEGSGISKLDAEPQDGPIEYKLHLLLRPRKSRSAIFLPSTIISLQQSKARGTSIQSGTASRLSLKTSSSTPPLQARQKRLEHLTTQLLWRLQQSSPYHSQSTLKLVPPALPESGPILNLPSNTAKLLPGLEDSKGALYEIGVADDGAFIGLTKEEMDESLINLRSMAASLGCKVEILRTVIVGQSEIAETPKDAAPGTPRTENLLVVEALVLPDTQHHSSVDAPHSPLVTRRIDTVEEKETKQILQYEDSQTAQLRISLTGSTTSGKSSLVGTLSTSALDSGRGKTRLSLLKHRHEIESGVTSSVAPELIGYHTINSDAKKVHVVNYGFGNISSWNDIHNAAEGERLVFLLDSAGHPRYRRTAVRGLVSWAPHWTLCCVSAEDLGDVSSRSGSINSSEPTIGSPSSSTPFDLSITHLDLCLKLGLRVIVAITKLDIATNSGLRNTLSKILSTIKAAGRNPILLKPDAVNRTSDELQTLSNADIAEVESVISNNDPRTLVPIVLTSAVKGSGIRKLHSLLRYLPIIEDPQPQTADGADEDAVFHIDEIFAKYDTTDASHTPKVVHILSGHLCYQDIEIGDQVLIGPCTTPISEPPAIELSRARSYPSRMTITSLHDLSRSAPKTHTLSSNHPTSSSIGPSTGSNSPALALITTTPINEADEWLQARVTSIRNLRLPLRKLLAGQVGTIGIELCNPDQSNTTAAGAGAGAGAAATTNPQKFRKGMVLIKQSPASLPPRASSGLKATFPSSAYHMMEPGALFTVYIASIRAMAKITSVETPASPSRDHHQQQQSSTTTTSTTSTTKPSQEQSPSPSPSRSQEQDAEDDAVFLFDDPDATQPEITYSASGRREVRYQPPLSPDIEVSLVFVGGGREWLRVGCKVLVMPTSVVEGGSGLDGVVGVVGEVF